MKQFRLCWVLLEHEGRWQLWPTNPEAYKAAEKALVLSDWSAIKRNRFAFSGGKAKLSVVLASLSEAGISEEDIAVKMPIPPDLGPIFDEASDAAKAGK